MEKINLTFQSKQILRASEMNTIVKGINDTIDEVNNLTFTTDDKIDSLFDKDDK